ncbi:DUF6427 family protein [Ascidiimonas aurantiaca]|uniref:DUF6427 family protein n=1 Tax=Ascidiimonas aurantiaca TaxID=1685432 RepID=UPI0030EF5439
MIFSSIFSKTKPVNFVLLLGYLWLFSGIAVFLVKFQNREVLSWAWFLSAVAFLSFSVFLVDFINRRNHLAQNNAYSVFLFVTITVSFPATFYHFEIICSGWFLLLAYRKILSFRSHTSLKKKIFDAGLWVSVACLFFKGSVLAFIPLFIGIALYAAKDIKNFVIPLLSVATVLIFGSTYFFLTEETDRIFQLFSFTPDIDLANYDTEHILFPSLVTGLLTLIAAGNFFLKIKTKTTTVKNIFVLVMVMLITAIAIVLFGPFNEGAILSFLAFPVATFGGNYLQNSTRTWLRELWLWLFALVPWVVLVL